MVRHNLIVNADPDESGFMNIGEGKGWADTQIDGLPGRVCQGVALGRQ